MRLADKNWKLIAENRKARFDFFIEDQYEAGMALVGTEVKSVRLGRVNLKDSYAKVVNGEIFVYQMHIGAYPFAYYDNHEPLRTRKLLLHKTEIRKLAAKLNEQGFTLIPLRVYIKDGKIKMTLGLARGKRKYDKRDTIRKRDQDRELRRVRKEL